MLELQSDENAKKFNASLWQYLDQGYLQPGQMPSGLMLWWMLLQALAALARYEPAAWTAAITPDRSKVAVPLEQTLQIAAMILPRLLREALGHCREPSRQPEQIPNSRVGNEGQT